MIACGYSDISDMSSCILNSYVKSQGYRVLGGVLSFYRVLAHCGVYTHCFTEFCKIPRLDEPGCPTFLLLDGILISRPFGGIIFGRCLSFYQGFDHVGTFLSPHLGS